jgi:predicted PhzF superfamily epimerase YddE/YHI9
LLHFALQTVAELKPEAVAFNANTKKLIIELQPTDVANLLTINPDASQLLSIDQSASSMQVSGVSVTVQAEPKNLHSADFYSRYFTPWNGIDEDPVNGSSHTILGPYWADKLRKYKGSSLPGMECVESSTTWKHARLRGVQQSARSGVLELEVFQEHTTSGVGKDSYVMIGGAAATTLQGRLA